MTVSNNMKIGLVCRCSALLVVALLASKCWSADREIKLDAEASLLKTEMRGPLLRVIITNNENASLSLYNADLPWKTRHSLMLVAVTNDAEMKRLEESLYVDDPGPGRVLIGAADKLEGTIDLSRRFPELAKILKEREVLVFWTYTKSLPSGAKTKRSSGAVVVPKAGS